jgi:hypothetical protein
VALAEDLARIAATRPGVTAVLAAEPTSGGRAYLLALGEDEERLWLVVDDAGETVDERERVREVASIVVMSELAAELAGAEDEVPRLASPAFLDELGAAQAGLGEFGNALASSAGAVEAFVAEVERRYAVPLR